MKIVFGYVILCVLIAVPMLVLLAIAYPAFGTRPSEEEKKRFETSAQFRKDKGEFDNRRSGLVSEMRKRIPMSVYKESLLGGPDRIPKTPLPQVVPELAEFLKPATHAKVIWLGHSTVLMNLRGKIILIDPVFSGHASPLWFMIRRFQPVAIELASLPPIDIVVISHDHYDHLDMETMKFFASKTTKFFVPLGVGSHLGGWGISRDHVTELDWWQAQKDGEIEFVATPAQHFSGRNGIHDNATLWASWVIRSGDLSFYVSGDSGYDSHFEEIGKRYGPFDVAFVENGQYNQAWQEVHMLPEQSVRAAKDLKAKVLFPIHWGMFNLAMHPWFEPIKRLKVASEENGVTVVSPKIGETFEVGTNYDGGTWWE